MSDVFVILCTFPGIEQARQIGTVLVERQLAACVNLIPAVESIYRWEGNVETAGEILALFKTTEQVYPEFQMVLSELHPYEVPEIVAIRPSEISPPYLAWLGSQVIGRE